MDPLITHWLRTREIMEAAQKAELAAYLDAEEHAVRPQHLRPATQADIVPGAIVWHRLAYESIVPDDPSVHWSWLYVEEASPFGFVDIHGNIYAIDNIWVEEKWHIPR